MNLSKPGLKRRAAPLLVCFVSTLSLLASGWRDALAASAPGQAAPGTPPVLPAPSPEEPNAPKITDFVVIGNKTLSKTYIVDRSGAKIGDRFTPELQARMVANLYSSGQFGENLPNPQADAVKVYSEEPNPPNGTCKVVIEVDENPTIKNITLTGTGPIKPEQILPLIHYVPGSVFSTTQFRRDLNDIFDLYSRKGYIADIGQDVFVDQNGVLHVPFVVTRVSEIKIVGLHKTRRYVVTREMQTKVGDYLNTNSLLQDRVRLLNLDLFDDVVPSTFDTGPGQVGVTISVVEKRTGSVNAGIGYSDRSQLIGFAQLVESNFRGTGEAVSLRAETGGVAGTTSVELGFNEPYLDRQHTSLNVQLYNKTVYRFANSFSSPIPNVGLLGTQRTYYEQRLGTTVTVSRPLARTVRAALSGRVENVSTNPLDLPVQDIAIIQNGPIQALSASLLHDTRDLELDPASGGFQSVSLEVGHANLKPPSNVVGVPLSSVFGSVAYLKTYLEAREYYSLTGPRPKNNPTKDETVFAVRAILAQAQGTLPFFEQFFLGGGDNLRGYRDDRFWGKYMVLGSMELRQPLAPKFKGVLFLDMGDAWGGPYSNVLINGFHQGGFRLHMGVGVGIRVVTPIGPLRLDYGIGDEGGRAHFSVGPTF